MATAWAQAGVDLPAFGTTHADYFHGCVPCTRPLSEAEIRSDYETETGKVIVETFVKRNVDPAATGAVLVHGHGPFTWGESVKRALENAIVLEEAASMAVASLAVNPRTQPVSRTLLDKHYFRKHGQSAYYGQS